MIDISSYGEKILEKIIDGKKWEDLENSDTNGLYREPLFIVKNCYTWEDVRVAYENLVVKSWYAICQEPKVRIRFSREIDSPTMLTVTIENNGTPFYGDMESVFEKGVSEKDEGGHGIGLYSARRFIKYHGGAISMFRPTEGGYNVGFKIQIPVLL